MIIKVECFQCGREFHVTVYQRVPARLHGRPEDCYPESGGEIEDDVCECGARFPEPDLRQLAAEAEKESKWLRAEANWEADHGSMDSRQ